MDWTSWSFLFFETNTVVVTSDVPAPFETAPFLLILIRMPDETFLSKSQTEVRTVREPECLWNRDNLWSGCRRTTTSSTWASLSLRLSSGLRRVNVIHPALFKGHMSSLLSEKGSLDKLSISWLRW